LLEKRKTTGGNLITSATPPNKEKLFWYYEFLLRRLERSTVTLKLGVEANREVVLAEQPDLVILANGSRLAPLDVGQRGKMLTRPAFEALLGEVSFPMSTKDKPVVIFGGAETGTETAEHLA